MLSIRADELFVLTTLIAWLFTEEKTTHSVFYGASLYFDWSLVYLTGEGTLEIREGSGANLPALVDPYRRWTIKRSGEGSLPRVSRNYEEKVSCSCRFRVWNVFHSKSRIPFGKYCQKTQYFCRSDHRSSEQVFRLEGMWFFLQGSREIFHFLNLSKDNMIYVCWMVLTIR